MGLFKGMKKAPKKSTLKGMLSESFNKNQTMEDVVESHEGFGEYVEDLKTLAREYKAYKDRSGYVDYDDILFYSKKILEEESIRKSIGNEISYIMVDEFQDTNKIQGEITYYLSAAKKNIMVVGDDAQSIYGFRGACHENILEFPRRFGQCEVIKLEKNYRSGQKILDVANGVLSTMEKKFAKHLMSATGKETMIPRVMIFKNAREEAEWIVETIREKVRAGENLRSMCALFRSSFISIPLQAELARKGIPYKIFGGMKFYEFAHIKDVLAHMKIALSYTDEIAWKRVLTLLPGIGAKSAHDVYQSIRGATSYDEAMSRFGESAARKGGDMQALHALLVRIGNEEKSVYEKLNDCVEYYIPTLQSSFDDWKSRINDLHVLKELAVSYNSLEEFIADIAIDAIQKRDEDEQKFFSLSTIHSAKGLEWDTVFLIGVADGILPSGMSLGKKSEIEEEKRLFYVAITRARKDLFLSFHRKSMNMFAPTYELSRFVAHPDVYPYIIEEGFYDKGYEEDESYDDDGIAYD
jgi:DNA helicase-2/ATP-dependent DNA helicase PcrA